MARSIFKRVADSLLMRNNDDVEIIPPLPEGYLDDGRRRLAPSEKRIDDLIQWAEDKGIKPCCVCRYQKAYRQWQCERYLNDLDCSFERAFSFETVNKRDLRDAYSLLSPWIETPPLETDNTN